VREHPTQQEEDYEMSRRALTNYAAAAGVLLALGAGPALAQDSSAKPADDQAREATSSTGEKITDAWILTKVKAQFVGEDALEGSDINVDVRNHAVYLKGPVASDAGKARAAEIARKTDGVTRVVNELRVGPKDEAADRDHTSDAATAGREAGRETKEAAHNAKEKTKETAREATDDVKESARDTKEAAKESARDASRETREVTGTAGEAVSDGWITTKVKSSFVGVDALDGSDIDVDTNDHVVTLRGTVPSAAARAKAVSLAKQVDGVKSVKDELTIGAKK
jgi:osmotically-inducible protein OsmY